MQVTEKSDLCHCMLNMGGSVAFPISLVPSALGQTLQGSVLPRGDSHSSLGVHCAADPSSARGGSEDVVSLCVIEEMEVVWDVAAMFRLDGCGKEGGKFLH